MQSNQTLVTIFNTNNLQLYVIKYFHWMKIIFKQIFWPIDRTLAGTTTLSQSEHRINTNRRVLHTPQVSKTGASSSDAV